MNDFSGKVVLVTGAGRGVGKVIAHRFAERGAHVLINFFHSLEDAKRTKAELEAAGANVDLLRASVAIRAQVERMFSEIKSRFGRLDVLVNNAASGALVSYEEVTDEFFDKAFDTNLKGSFWCSRYAAPLMAKNGGGSIVNLSTLGGEKLVMANYLACGVAKAAVEACTRYLASELASANVRVNTAAAGMLQSTVADQFPDGRAMQRVVAEATPLGRLGLPEEYADVILFLASDQARWVTGQTVLADGGLSLGRALLSPPRGAPARDAPEAPSTRVAAVAQDHDPDAIAIVGMGLVVPGASTPQDYWQILMNGADTFRKVPADRWNNAHFHSSVRTQEDKTYSEHSAFIVEFQPLRGAEDVLDPTNAEYSTLWLRHALVQALGQVKRLPEDRYSFSVGYTADGSQHLEEAMVLAGARARLGEALDRTGSSESELQALKTALWETLAKRYARGALRAVEFLPHRVGRNAMANILPVDTELQMVDTACSSSLYAVDLGIKGLQNGKHDIAVCGGAFALGPRGSILFAKLNGLSARGEVRALDAQSDGVLFADGAGVIVLKKLGRALADGDTILGLAERFGSSSDGKGKAIYAPSSSGQELAIRRAFGSDQPEVDWVVAHATGTPAGDLAEFTTLRSLFSSTRPVQVTSNKSVIGHTGWAAGVVSIIEVLLALQHRTIPPQHRFTAPPKDFAIETSSLRIPDRPVAWPERPDRARVAAVSGFGFGGTNAHLVLQEFGPSARTKPRRRREAASAARERVGIIGWAAHLPGIESDEALRDVVLGLRTAERSFGDSYPTPDFQRVRMPKTTLRTIDRSQLMILECAHRMRDKLGQVWESNKAATGVFLGHMGATRNATLYGLRCYLDDLREAVLENPKLAQSNAVSAALNELGRTVKELVPASNEDSFPGSMPNVIPARIANYFGLNGLNMTLDTGFTSMFTAFEVAASYLRSFDLDVALVGGINGNVTAEMSHLLDQLPGAANAVWSEGAVLFALARETTARRQEFEVLAWVDEDTSRGRDPRSAARQFSCGFNPGDTARPNYLGAEGGPEILRALLDPVESTRVRFRREDGATRTLVVEAARAETYSDTAATQAETKENVPSPGARFPESIRGETEWAAGTPLKVHRYVIEHVPEEPSVVHARTEFLVANSVILTDRPSLLDGIELPKGVFVLTTQAHSGGGRIPLQAPALTEEAVGRCIAALGPIHHVRVLASFEASAPAETCLLGDPGALRDLHTLTFLALKACAGKLGRGSSFVSAFCAAITAGRLHPYSGLFAGLVKCSALEFPQTQCFAVFTSEKSVAAAFEQAALESQAGRSLPTVLYDDGVRMVPNVTPSPGGLPETSESWLTPGSVVVAVGGARGITAELLKSIARQFHPHIHVLGSNDLDAYPAWVFDGSEQTFRAKKPDFVRSRTQQGKSVATAVAEFSRMTEARKARENLEQMRRLAGPSPVVYHAASVTDRDALMQAMSAVVAAESRIDLLINAAGTNKSAPIASKSLADFLGIRDVKLLGYHNLKAALQSCPPRVWCNFGSLLGMTGQLGEADYASANDFLSTAALFGSATGREFTLGWTLWGEVGLGANELTRAYFEKTGIYSNMSTDEGVHHFLRELHQTAPARSIVHMGTAERAAVGRLIPGLLASAAPVVSESGTEDRARRPFYVAHVAQRSEQEVCFERLFDLERDAYLSHHCVDGHPTLPGTFLTEIAAEACLELLPGMSVIGFEDIVFEHFLRVYRDKVARPKRIRAKIVSRSANQALVNVQVTTDVVSPGGRLLVQDKPHFAINVLAATEYLRAPRWESWGEYGATAVPDPYHVPGSPVVLTGPFVSTTRTRVHPLGKQALSAIDFGEFGPVFERFVMPSVSLDGLARVGVLGTVHGDYLPIAAPSAIRRIDIYEPGNDLELWRAHGALELYATPAGFDMSKGRTVNRLAAVRRDGRVVLEMKDIRAVVIGYLRRSTGTFHSPDELERVRTASSGAVNMAEYSKKSALTTSGGQ